jgi:hypothetical protein
LQLPNHEGEFAEAAHFFVCEFSCLQIFLLANLPFFRESKSSCGKMARCKSGTNRYAIDRLDNCAAIPHIYDGIGVVFNAKSLWQFG